MDVLRDFGAGLGQGLLYRRPISPRHDGAKFVAAVTDEYDIPTQLVQVVGEDVGNAPEYLVGVVFPQRVVQATQVADVRRGINRLLVRMLLEVLLGARNAGDALTVGEPAGEPVAECVRLECLGVLEPFPFEKGAVLR